MDKFTRDGIMAVFGAPVVLAIHAVLAVGVNARSGRRVGVT